ncbi:3-oxoacyl-(acyl carrier protein) synthase [Enhygromyxa salina]|uniref:3-oxoacyl-(Acyl carrier protein) synthase n=1 Tax=Enhygromyxa salina TaxID=215803 RepID=A0A2S9XUM2_9BACT|nr:3-oxoacyl-ACP synthase [Enhygromyxa salina]PRP96568.1 3-oxoacyl-(acyl carrier protein) synthase [Enhygromyxa salina]
MSAGQLAVYAQGMVTAVGFDAPTSCAAMRGGLSGLYEDNLWDILVGEYLSVGRPLMHQWWEGRDMLAELLAPPILECVDALASIPGWEHIDPRQVPIVVIVPPEHRPHRWEQLDTALLADLAHKLGHPLAVYSSTIAGGRAGIVAALEVAAQLCGRAELPVCVIAGVESFMRQRLAVHYLRQRRMKSEVNSNGFVAGEAASAILVGPARAARAPQLLLTGVGWAEDPAGAGDSTAHPVTGRGLTAAIRQALAQAGHSYAALDLRLCDINGEHWKFKESAFAEGRLDRARPEGLPARRLGYCDVWHPIELIGEVGAAVFPLLLGWLRDAYCKGYDRGPRSLVFAMEDAGERAAVTCEFWSPT